MALKNKALAGTAMEDDALETVTGGASPEEPMEEREPDISEPGLIDYGIIKPQT